ncbi:hypothetical protein RradSPS_2251 [Rubrobacter radiotolerans]|uniref:TVP38/TMEM64 family membrane protein n=1 Tax=Rubrobacter radiotolerans TaxID=42256 RepID=A0A023X666_RUBRA|nr:TVP38/TMEM64 family protein [Rubrobacter radiotolerans]AHY47534.1 hypothetical protein RradSPS_2251 [Rubrobacter radiotolerans]MDX5894937.1 TVP38/TMEM64 family protein [Rubrobacter radiotolerans]SMC07113.1 Uncharacterized membrane protein YdjX, TVP38/TMEM64 family, SNARE-associated domain [Rubrobacter radiotolerans DSM 5868]
MSESEARRRTGRDERTLWLLRLGVAVAAVALVGGVYLISESFRAEVGVVLGILGRGDVEGLRDYILAYGALAPLASLSLMVVQAIAAPLPAFFITFANGLAFGVFWGWLLSLAGHALAAAVCFGISRALGRRPVELLVGRAGLRSADEWFARWGMYAVFVGRLVPGVSFDVISYAAGLTRMRFVPFMAATTLGIAPQTFLYSFLGRQAPEYLGLFLLTTALALGGFAVYVLARRRRRERYARDGAAEKSRASR